MKSLGQVHRLRLTVGDYYYLLTREHRVDNPPAFLRRINTLRHGFFSNKTLYYDFRRYDPSLYVSDVQMNRTRTINGKHGDVLDSKIVFERILPSAALTPKNYAWLQAGKLRSLSEEWRETTFEDLIAKSNEHGKLVLKPVRGIGGRGVFIIGPQGNSINVNNKTVSIAQARAQLSKLNDYLVTEFVQQGEFPSSIFPGSVNTIRVLTMSDPDTEEPFVAAAAHRFGSRVSAPVDNLHAGGLSALIDLESGVLSAAAERGEDRLIMHDIHPDTGAQISGRVVPNWSALKEHVLEVANRLPFLCYVGWDIALTAKGPVFIEGNKQPNPRPFQLHRPLLLDPRIKRFYEKHGII
jgi:Sugar-transfer associated ATP-grasp